MQKKINRITILFFGLKIGLFYLLKTGQLKVALKRIILPFNYWRGLIFRIVAENLLRIFANNKTKIKILDIGSPKMLSLFLSSKLDATIYATDLQDEAIFSEWKKLYEENTHKGEMVFRYLDAKSIDYPDDYFDVVYSLSVIHMITPGKDGDIKALNEIQKKIVPGGLLIIEVPYRTQYVENYANRNNFEESYSGDPVFQERQYDEYAIEDRIVKNISGKLLNKIHLYEFLPFDAAWYKLPRFITMLFAFIEPWADMCNVFVAHNKKQIRKAKSIILFFEINR